MCKNINALVITVSEDLVRLIVIYHKSRLQTIYHKPNVVASNNNKASRIYQKVTKCV